METFYKNLAVCLEDDTVQPGDVLRDFDVWDSLTALSILAMVFRDFKITDSADELRASTTAGDLWNVVHRKITPA